jgi:hypothetical protein
MIKRIIALLVVGLFICSNVFAVEFMSTDTRKTLSAYVIVNPSSVTTGGTNNANLITAVSTSTIVPGFHRIIGYDVVSMDTGAKAEKWVTLVDTTEALFKATTVSTAATGQFAENEANDGDVLSKTFAYPKEIATQLVVNQGQNTVVTIYYDVR